jgi:hypothetical protein
VLFAYFGPETFLPVTSAIAGVVGVFLMFGRSSIRLLLDGLRKGLSLVGLAKATERRVPNRPHVALGPKRRPSVTAVSDEA